VGNPKPSIRRLELLSISDPAAAVNASKLATLTSRDRCSPSSLLCSLIQDASLSPPSSHGMRRTRCREMIRKPVDDVACGKRSRTQSTCRYPAKRRPGARPTGKDSSSVRDVRTHNANDDVSLRSQKARSLLNAAGYGNGVDVHFAVWQGIIPLGEVVTPAIAGISLRSASTPRWTLRSQDSLTKILAQPRLFISSRIGDRMDEWRSIPLHDRHRSRAAALHRSGFDKPVKQMSTTPDGPARLRLLAKVQQLFMQELPSRSVVLRDAHRCVREKAQGLLEPERWLSCLLWKGGSRGCGAFGRVESRMTAWGGCCV